MLLCLLPRSYERTHWPIGPGRILFFRLPSMFVFSLEGQMYHTRAAVTGNAFTELAILVISVQFFRDTAGYITFFLWLIWECRAIWSSEFSLSFFQINHAW